MNAHISRPAGLFAIACAIAFVVQFNASRTSTLPPDLIASLRGADGGSPSDQGILILCDDYNVASGQVPSLECPNVAVNTPCVWCRDSTTEFTTSQNATGPNFVQGELTGCSGTKNIGTCQLVNGVMSCQWPPGSTMTCTNEIYNDFWQNPPGGP